FYFSYVEILFKFDFLFIVFHHTSVVNFISVDHFFSIIFETSTFLYLNSPLIISLFSESRLFLLISLNNLCVIFWFKTNPNSILSLSFLVNFMVYKFLYELNPSSYEIYEKHLMVST